MTAWVVIVSGSEAGAGGGASSHENRCRVSSQVGAELWGKREGARKGRLMRMLGALEAPRGWCFQAKHVKGVEESM